MFTCAACRNESTRPLRIKGVGLVCRLCAAFLIRSELSFDESALREQEAVRRLRG